MAKSTKESKQQEPMTISEARIEYVNKLPKDKHKGDVDIQLNEFARWLDGSGKRLVSNISAVEIGEFSDEHYSRSSLPDHELLRVVKRFLQYLHQKGHIEDNISINIRVSRGGRVASSKATTIRRREGIQLTKEGHSNLVKQRDMLQKEKLRIVEEIERAAADGDFRENAPLDAAREEHARITNKLTEAEETLQVATIIDDRPGAGATLVRVGSKLELINLDSKVKYKCQIVAPKEADPLKDKISTSSPVGAALLNAKAGDEVKVTLPKGKISYKVESIS